MKRQYVLKLHKARRDYWLKRRDGLIKIFDRIFFKSCTFQICQCSLCRLVKTYFFTVKTPSPGRTNRLSYIKTSSTKQNTLLALVLQSSTYSTLFAAEFGITVSELQKYMQIDTNGEAC